MSGDRYPLPPILAAIAEAAGEEAALLIAQTHGGTRVLMPVAPGRNWLTDLLGAERARTVVEALGPARRIDIPIGPKGLLAEQQRSRAALFAALEAREASEHEVARVLGITGRAVRYRRAARRARSAVAVRDLFE